MIDPDIVDPVELVEAAIAGELDPQAIRDELDQLEADVATTVIANLVDEAQRVTPAGRGSLRPGGLGPRRLRRGRPGVGLAGGCPLIGVSRPQGLGRRSPASAHAAAPIPASEALGRPVMVEGFGWR
jgi:hypothetical protein